MSDQTAPSHLVAVLNHPEEVRTAFPWAALLARQFGLPLTLLHVIDPVSSRELAENAEAMARDMLALLASSDYAAGLDLRTLVETGKTDAVLPEVAAQEPGPVFVMAAGEHGTFARTLLGRGRNSVVHQLGSPIVFLPANAGAPRPIERAVAGIDGSAIAARARDMARQLLGDVPLTTVEVIEPGGLPAEDYLRLEPQFDETHIRMRGRAGVALLAAARARDAGLIAVGRHGASGLFGQRLGGTAEWLSQHADRPVLIVPPSPE